MSEILVWKQFPDDELQRTRRPDTPPSDFIWVGDTFRRVGYQNVDMGALSVLDPALKESFKQAALAFANKGDYAQDTYPNFLRVINFTLKCFPNSSFDTTWAAQALQLSAFGLRIGILRSFFIDWKSRNPQAISDQALQLLVKTKLTGNVSSNVLSDDPELSWLTDAEYETLLASVWRHYEDDVFSTQRTLILLLSMQYARRPVQLAQLKIGDCRIVAPGDSSGLNGPVVSFPGVKDLSAEKGFRDSKFEIHPLPEHLWNLFEIQREQVRALFEAQLDVRLSEFELIKLPVFTTASRIKNAVSELKNHYRIDWRTQLDHHLFHMPARVLGKILAWRPNGYEDIPPPLSHRTGRSMKVTATRLRHTRARQLARKGVPLHVLSHWLGHTTETSLKAYYNDPAENARQLDEAMAPMLMPLAMAFAGTLIDSEEQASRRDDPASRLEFAGVSELKSVGHCGKHSFCATTSVPIPCYRCRHFEMLVTAPHQEVLEALQTRQEAENQALRVGGSRNLLIPIDLSADIRAVQDCIDRCNARKNELGID